MAQDVPIAPRAPSLGWRTSSSLVMGIVGLLSRSFLLFGNRLQVNGLDEFLDLLHEREDVGARSKGLITVSNHLSVIDDPLMWGVLPYRYHWSPNNLRWALGSHDITFKNAILSKFFIFGQVLPTHRQAHSPFGGLFQPTITQAIQLLSRRPLSTFEDDLQESHYIADPFSTAQLTYTTNGVDVVPSPSAYLSRRHAWIHVYPEGRIHQKKDKTMRYFKWGISRMILESDPCPDMVPIWIEGIDQIMHESREFPRFIPRPGKNVSVTFGRRVDMDAVFGDLRRRWQELRIESKERITEAERDTHNLSDELRYGADAVKLRQEVTMRVREQVLELRRQRGWSEEDPKARLVDTWREEGVSPEKREGHMADGSWVKDI